MEEIIELYVQLRNTSSFNPNYYLISSRLNSLVERWNSGEGTRCSCGVILQTTRSGTLMNCQTSRRMLGLPAMVHQ
jgi:hypothetical protein